MVDGVIGETIQVARRPVRPESKQRLERVLILLQLMVEFSALDQRQIQGTAMLMNAVRIVFEKFFYQIVIDNY